MLTTVESDDQLVEQAMRLTGARTKEQVITAGLRLLV